MFSLQKKTYTKEFDDYLINYKIDCSCPIRKKELYEVYNKNQGWIQTNENKVGFTVGDTSLAIMKPEDFVRMNKTKPDEVDYTIESKTPDKLPESIDWSSIKDKKYVSRVINQGECGACWAFTATGVVESAIAIRNKKMW